MKQLHREKEQLEQRIQKSRDKKKAAILKKQLDVDSTPRSFTKPHRTKEAYQRIPLAQCNNQPKQSLKKDISTSASKENLKEKDIMRRIQKIECFLTKN